MKANINTLEELKLEIARLKRLRGEQEVYLGNQFSLIKQKIDRPAQVMGAIATSIPGVNLLRGFFSTTDGASNKTGEQQDWMSRVLRIGIPYLLHKTILKKSGWFKKALVLLASQSAAGQLSREGIVKAISKLTDVVRPSRKRGAKEKPNKKSDKSVVVDASMTNSEEEQVLGI